MKRIKFRKTRIQKQRRAEKRLISLLTAIIMLCSSFLLIIPVSGTEASDAGQTAGTEIAAESGMEPVQTAPEESAQMIQEPLAAEPITIMPDTSEPDAAAESQSGNEGTDPAEEENIADPAEEENTADPAEEGNTANSAEEENTADPAEGNMPSDAEDAEAGKEAGETNTEEENTALAVSPLVYECGEYTVRVFFGESAEIPEGASLSWREFNAGSMEYNTYRSILNAKLKENGLAEEDLNAAVSAVRFFELTFTDKDGARILPADAVDVFVEYKNEASISAPVTDETLYAVTFSTGDDQMARAELIERNAADGSAAVETAEEAEGRYIRKLHITGFAAHDTHTNTVIGQLALKPQTEEAEEDSVPAATENVEAEAVITRDVPVEGAGYSLKLQYGPEAGIPEDAVFRAVPVLEDHVDYEVYRDRALSVIDGQTEAGKTFVLLGLFDLTIYDAEGNVIEPLAPVTVTANMAGTQDAGIEDVYAVHFMDAAAEPAERSAETAEEPTPASQAQIEVITATNAGEEMIFEASSFSVYVLVATTTMETSVLASDGHNYKITVTCGPEAGIPEGAGLSVTELSGEAYEAYLGRAAAALDAAGFAYARIFDISIVDAAGQKLQPAAPVEVAVDLLDGDASAGDFSVVHFSGAEENPEEIAVTGVASDAGAEMSAETEADLSAEAGADTASGTTAEMAAGDSTENSGCKVVFTTTGFSAYAIVQGPAAVPLGWTKLSSMDQLRTIAGDGTGVYIGTTGGFYMTNKTALGTQSRTVTGIVKTKPEQVYPSDPNAVKYYFETVEGGNDLFYIYCYGEDSSKQYVYNSGNDADLTFTDEANRTAFHVQVNNNSGFRMNNGDRYWNMYNGSGGNHIAAYNVAGDNGNYFNIWMYDDEYEEQDPYGLDGKTYGLMNWIEGTTGKAMMASANETVGHLNALALTVMSKEKNGKKLYVPDNSEISFFTFQFLEDDIYQVSSVVDGSTKYLRIADDGVSMVSTPDEACKIKVVPGSGSHAGSLCLQAGNATLAYSGKIDQGFQTGGATGNEWLWLAEESELDDTYFMTYSARKVSVSDSDITNGSRVIVYTRVWNEVTKRYEFYAVDHDGSLVRCYESGDSIEWVSGRLNSMLWNFTEYYWEGTTDPNYYYDLYNQYSEKYMAPQKSNGQILSDSSIGINLNGRRNGQYYSPIVAWDDGFYAYTGLKADKVSGKIVSCPLPEADDFYFAIVQDIPVDDELTTVPTVDHKQYGITMKMINFGTDLYKGNNDNNVRKAMSDYLGSDNVYHNGNVEPGLLGTKLGDDGYPVTKASNSLSEWFSARPEVNHLFIQSTYSGTGYFEYDSVQNFAHLNETTGNFEVYKELAASASTGQFHDHGHFWPYNDIKAGMFANNKNIRDALGKNLPESDPRKYERLYAIQKSNTNFAPDYYMGMEVTATFTQTPNGLDDWGHDIIYEFTGDDDFWLFVDGELIIDLGGIHDALEGTVNYRTGKVYVNGINTTLRTLFENNYRDRNPEATDAVVTAYLDEIFDGEIFKDYTTHTMKIYYLERGAGASNLHMRFNLASIKPGTVQLTKHLSGVDSTETVLAEFPYQILYRTKETVKDPKTGETTDQIKEYYLTNAVPDDPARTEDYVFYKDMTVPVTYKPSHTVAGITYNDVFILKPEETADIHFPVEELPEGVEFLDYKIIECGVNTEVYTEVTVNGEPVMGTGVVDDQENPVADRKDYPIGYATTDARARVVYDNAVSEDAISDLTITKRLFDVTGEHEITEQDDRATFDFRLYLASETGDIDNSPANMHTYHVKDTGGNYCYWDVEQQRLIRLGVDKKNYDALTDEEKEAAAFHTSMNGSITKIPVGYTIELRDLLVGTRFKVVERPTEVPDGYSFKKYIYNNKTYTDAWEGVEHMIQKGEKRQNVEVHNAKGFGMRINKSWSDELFMSDRDPVYFGVFCANGSGSETDWQLIDGSLRQMPYGTSSVYWYYDTLPGASIDFEDYALYEVILEDPTVDTDGVVTSYSSMKILEEGASLMLSGKQTGDTDSSPFTYSVNYERGEIGTDDNVRVDQVNNTRPGIVLKKTQWDGTTALPGAEFTLVDDDGKEIGTFTSDADGQITEVFLRENAKYTLTETKAPQGWHGLDAPMQITLNSDEEHTVTIAGVEKSCYTITYSDGTAENEKTTITVKDRPYEFKVVKMDKGTSAPLAGVEFALYRLITVDTVESWDPNPYPGFTKIISGTDGVIPGLDNTLPAGTYELRETKALSGYPALSHHTDFTITKTGEVTPYRGHPLPKEAKLEETRNEETGTVQYTLTLTNAKEFPVSIWKTDEKSVVLTAGASFVLYDEAGYDTEAGKPREGAEPVISGTTGNNGLLALGTRQVGTYYLVETAAPAGYNLLATPVVITVTNDGVMATQGIGGEALTVNKEGDTNWVLGQDSKTLQIQVKNTPGTPLPLTGGPGTRLFMLFGMILTAGAGLLLWRRRRFYDC